MPGAASEASAAVAALAGGDPVLTGRLAAALRDRVADGSVAAAADVVAEELIREHAPVPADPDWSAALRRLAVAGTADRDLLGVDEAGFDALARSVLVVRTEYGLAVREPYRTLFDVATQWREPMTHRAILTRAAEYRRGQLMSTAGGGSARAGLLQQVLFAAGPPPVREMLFPPGRPVAAVPAMPVVEKAGRADEDEVVRLIDRWAQRGGLDVRASEDLIGGWLGATPDSFHLIRDRDGVAIALANLVPVRDGTAGRLENLLQQHTETAVADPDGTATLFVGLAFGESPAEHAAILRHILAAGLDHGRLVVATSFPHYQKLVRSLGFQLHGTTRDDVFASGRPTEVFSQHMSPLALPGWLDRLGRGGDPLPDPVRFAQAVRHALEVVRRPDDLARSPLLAAPGCLGPAALRDRLHAEVAALAASGDAADAEAGRILDRYYLRREGGHDLLAHRLHLSRATYFRRLERGLLAVARAFTSG